MDGNEELEAGSVGTRSRSFAGKGTRENGVKAGGNMGSREGFLSFCYF